MKLIITDITEMHGGNFCVAGWRAKTGRMVRPLPNGANWTAAQLSAFQISPGAAVRVTAIPIGSPAEYPHRTEDTWVDPATISAVTMGTFGWFGIGAPPTASTLSDAFGGHLSTTGEWNGTKKGCHVPEGVQTGSLAAVRIARASLQFFEDDYNGKRSLRAYITDTTGRYNLPIVAKELRELYRASGTAAVNASLPQSGRLHVRVGLARAWAGQQGRCFAMINGVFW